MQKMSDFLNENVFGSPDKPGYYHVPMDQKTEDLGEVKFNDGVATKLEMVLVEKIVPIFLSAGQKVDKWQECCKILIEIMKMLRKRVDFTDQNIHENELKIADWSKLTGREGVTNYTHSLTSGHIEFFTKERRNLYRFFNQGWEHHNASIIYFYNHRTHIGGSSGKSRGSSLKTKPIGLWFLRLLFWKKKICHRTTLCLLLGI
jgi:hypothetical protein